jgi:3-hydroxyacyl-CoA dehydrogenase
VLIPYLAESLTMATEGTPIPTIDDAMKRWGMPMGPFELLDEIGLDVAAYVLKSLGEKLRIGPRRPRVSMRRSRADGSARRAAVDSTSMTVEPSDRVERVGRRSTTNSRE